MNSRYGGIQMPEIRLADVGEYRRKKLMKGSFSPLLLLFSGSMAIYFAKRYP